MIHSLPVIFGDISNFQVKGRLLQVTGPLLVKHQRNFCTICSKPTLSRISFKIEANIGLEVLLC